jgi:hypothetical protein
MTRATHGEARSPKHPGERAREDEGQQGRHPGHLKLLAFGSPDLENFGFVGRDLKKNPGGTGPSPFFLKIGAVPVPSDLPRAASEAGPFDLLGVRGASDGS